MSWRDRILDDGNDREKWLGSRGPVIGASDAATYVNPASEDKYVAAKLKVSTFTGNDATRAGHEWEERLLAAIGLPQSLAFIHSPDEIGFGATPDSIIEKPEGIVLGEAKIKHNKIVYGPTPREFRQVAWQQFCVGPEVLYTEFVWGELVNGELRMNALEPKKLRIYPHDVAHLLPPMIAIATPVLARVRLARQFALENAL